jgi:hypothetical protein
MKLSTRREGINYTNAPQCYVTSRLSLLANNEFEEERLEGILSYFTVLPGRIQDNKHKIRDKGTVMKCRGHQTAERLHRGLGVSDIEYLYVRTCVCVFYLLIYLLWHAPLHCIILHAGFVLIHGYVVSSCADLLFLVV